MCGEQRQVVQLTDPLLCMPELFLIHTDMKQAEGDEKGNEEMNSEASSWKTNQSSHPLRHQSDNPPNPAPALPQPTALSGLPTATEHNKLLDSSVVFDSSAVNVTDSVTLPLPSDSAPTTDLSLFRPIPAPRSPRNRKLPPVTAATSARKLPALPAASTAQTIDITDGPSSVREVTMSRESSKKSLDSWDVITVNSKPAAERHQHTDSERCGDILEVRRSHMLNRPTAQEREKLTAQSLTTELEEDTLGSLLPDNQYTGETEGSAAVETSSQPAKQPVISSASSGDLKPSLPVEGRGVTANTEEPQIVQPVPDIAESSEGLLADIPQSHSLPESIDIPSDAPVDILSKPEFGKTYTVSVYPKKVHQPDATAKPAADEHSVPQLNINKSTGVGPSDVEHQVKSTVILPEREEKNKLRVSSRRLTKHHSSDGHTDGHTQSAAVTRDDLAATTRARHRTAKKGRRSRSAPRYSDAVLITPGGDTPAARHLIADRAPASAVTTSLSPVQRATVIAAEPHSCTGGDNYDPTSDSAYQVRESLAFVP